MCEELLNLLVMLPMLWAIFRMVRVLERDQEARERHRRWERELVDRGGEGR